MAFSEWIRRVGYWSVDLLRGGKVRRHYLDIRDILENEAGPQASRKKEEYLRSILAYAVENVEFYKKYTGAASLADFPVVNKNIIRDDYAAFQSAEYAQARVHSLHTSGS